MKSREQKQKQWDQIATQKLEQSSLRAQIKWDTKERAQKLSKYRYVRILTGCSY